MNSKDKHDQRHTLRRGPLMQLACAVRKPCLKTARTFQLGRSNSLLCINGGGGNILSLGVKILHTHTHTYCNGERNYIVGSSNIRQ